MQQFRINKEGLAAMQKKMVTRMIVIVLIMIAFMLTAIVIATADVDPPPAERWLTTTIIIVITSAFMAYRIINKQKTLYASYSLTLTENLIRREMYNTPTVSLYFNEIKEISRISSGTLIIRGNNRSDIIAIPSQVENFEELSNTLNQIRPIGMMSSRLYAIKLSLMIVVTVGLMFSVYKVTNKIIVVGSGILLITLLLWGLYDIRRNKNVDAKTKRGMWLVLVVVVSIIMAIVAKLKGG